MCIALPCLTSTFLFCQRGLFFFLLNHIVCFSGTSSERVLPREAVSSVTRCVNTPDFFPEIIQDVTSDWGNSPHFDRLLYVIPSTASLSLWNLEFLSWNISVPQIS